MAEEEGPPAHTQAKESAKSLPLLQIDAREPRDVIDKLRERAPKHGLQVKVGLYEVADYFVGNRLGIERKTPSDFRGSIVSKRLFAQAEELHQNFETAIILVDGSYKQVLYDRFAPRMNGAPMRAAVCSLYARRGVSVFFADDDFLGTLLTLAEKATKEPTVEYDPVRRGATVEESRVHLLAGLPGLGPKRAKALIERFGTPIGAFLHVEEWKQVEGIGPKTIEKAKKVIFNEGEQ